MTRAWDLSCYMVPVLLSPVPSLDHVALQNFWATFGTQRDGTEAVAFPHTHTQCLAQWMNPLCGLEGGFR